MQFKRNMNLQWENGATRLVVLLIIVLLLFVTLIIFSWSRWESNHPIVRLNRNFKALGRNPSLSVTIQDAETGLKNISVILRQKDQAVSLVDEHYAGPGFFDFWKHGDRDSKQFDLGKLIVDKYKIQDGPASLEISATDYSFGHFFHGNRTDVQRNFVFDLYPPRLEVISEQHYINQGGTECVVYRVSPDAEVSGVQAGPYFFHGYPAGGPDPNLKFALFAFVYNLDSNTPLKVFARDAAGNEAVAGFWYKLFPKKFRSSEINVDDSFLQRVVPEILSHTPEMKDQGDLVKTFLDINSNLRKKDHAEIMEISKKSAPRFLWNGAFLQLSNSQVESLFADHRTYLYQGKVIDHQDHVGFDLSVVQHYPIEAANDGVVVYADYFGIYGNCVMIDHGVGLLSLYGHMSSIDVKVGQSVKKKQVLGRSGATGLAGGDHLHFGLFLQGVPVNPTEWWDEKWINDHVLNRLKAATATSTP